MADKKSTIIGFPSSHKDTAVSLNDTVFFNRHEFSTILNMYGKMVASGHWKDYAIDSLREEAIFSVYQNVHDRPLYQIFKTPKLSKKQGTFRIVSSDGKVLKRGHDIDKLLTYFNKSLIKLIR